MAINDALPLKDRLCWWHSKKVSVTCQHSRHAAQAYV